MVNGKLFFWILVGFLIVVRDIGGVNVGYNLGNMFLYDFEKGEVIGDKEVLL